MRRIARKRLDADDRRIARRSDRRPRHEGDRDRSARRDYPTRRVERRRAPVGERVHADGDRRETAYDKVIASGQASQWEKDSAVIKLLEAQRAAMVVNGRQIPADFQKMLDDLNAKTAIRRKDCRRPRRYSRGSARRFPHHYEFRAGHQ